jgi:hypothetical protein
MSSLKIWLLFLLFSKPNIDRPHQTVSAAIIPNSVVDNFSPKAEVPMKLFWMKSVYEIIIFLI